MATDQYLVTIRIDREDDKERLSADEVNSIMSKGITIQVVEGVDAEVIETVYIGNKDGDEWSEYYSKGMEQIRNQRADKFNRNK